MMNQVDTPIVCSNCGATLATVEAGKRRPTPASGIKVLHTGGECCIMACHCGQWQHYATLGARPADEAAARSRAAYLTLATGRGDNAEVARLGG